MSEQEKEIPDVKAFFIVASTLAIIFLSGVLFAAHIAFNNPVIAPQIMDALEAIDFG